MLPGAATRVPPLAEHGPREHGERDQSQGGARAEAPRGVPEHDPVVPRGERQRDPVAVDADEARRVRVDRRAPAGVVALADHE